MDSANNAAKVVDNQEQQRFEIQMDGLVAYAAYSLNGDTITFSHTEVPSQFRGQGIGGQVAAGALDAARERNLRVVATCPFMSKFIEQNSEYESLLK